MQAKMELGDKETVAIYIYIQASVTCYLHVIHRYTRIVCTICAYGYTVRVWYTKLYHTRIVHTIRVLYIPYAYGIKYVYGTEQLHC